MYYAAFQFQSIQLVHTSRQQQLATSRCIFNGSLTYQKQIHRHSYYLDGLSVLEIESKARQPYVSIDTWLASFVVLLTKLLILLLLPCCIICNSTVTAAAAVGGIPPLEITFFTRVLTYLLPGVCIYSLDNLKDFYGIRFSSLK